MPFNPLNFDFFQDFFDKMTKNNEIVFVYIFILQLVKTVIDEFVFSAFRANDSLFSSVVIWLIMIDHAETRIVLGFCSGLRTLCI